MPVGQQDPRLHRQVAHRGLTAAFDAEDFVLAAWLLGVSWVARALLGEAPLSGTGQAAADVPPAAWVILALLAFLLLTRGPDDVDLDNAIKRRVLLVGPAYPLLSLYGLVGAQLRKRWRARTPGGGPEADAGDTWPGPLVARMWRRAAAVPVVLVADGLFRDDIGTLLPAATDLADPSAVLQLAMVVAAFVFLVAGPRIAAGATMSPWPWVARLGLAVAAAWTGGQLTGGF